MPDEPATKPSALDIVDSARKHQAMLDANKKAQIARLSRRDIRRAMGERGLELLDQHDEAIRQAHERLSTLGKDFAQIATDIVDLGNTMTALLASVQHLRADYIDESKAHRAGVNREVDDVRMQLGELDEYLRRLAMAVRDLDARLTPPKSFGARLRILLWGAQEAAGATNAGPRVVSSPDSPLNRS